MRLIDAHELKRKFEKEYPIAINDFGFTINKRFYELIDETPTVEQTIYFDCSCENCELDRQQGKWKDVTPQNYFTPGGDPIIICPFCEDVESRHLGGVEGKHWNFCPICGADLREET